MKYCFPITRMKKKKVKDDKTKAGDDGGQLEVRPFGRLALIVKIEYSQIPCTPHSSPHKSLHHETSNAWSSTREHKWPVNPPLLPRAAPGRSVTPACCTRVECRTGPGLGRPSPASTLFLPGGWLLQATPSGPSDGGYAEYLWAKATIEALHE